MENADKIPLNPALFFADAVVLKHLKATEMSILSLKTQRGLKMTFENFPYFGIWSAKNAPFVCLEPWCGVADSVSTTQDLTEKEGINQLGRGERFERTWRVELF